NSPNAPNPASVLRTRSTLVFCAVEGVVGDGEAHAEAPEEGGAGVRAFGGLATHQVGDAGGEAVAGIIGNDLADGPAGKVAGSRPGHVEVRARVQEVRRRQGRRARSVGQP